MRPAPGSSSRGGDRLSRGGEAELEAVNLLDLAPVRTARWEERDDGRVVIARPRPASRGVMTPFEWLAFLLAPSRLRLDELGSFAWRSLDGRVTVGQLAEAVRERFGDSAEPVEQRLGRFVRDLRREQLLGFPGWDL